MTEHFWGEQRQNYRNICDLVRHVDDTISIVTLLSISNNLFFICASILNSLKYCEYLFKSCVKLTWLVSLQLSSHVGAHGVLLVRVAFSDRSNLGRVDVHRSSERRISASLRGAPGDSPRGLVSGGETFCRRGHERYGCPDRDEVLQHDSQAGAQGDRVDHNLRTGVGSVSPGRDGRLRPLQDETNLGEFVLLVKLEFKSNTVTYWYFQICVS